MKSKPPNQACLPGQFAAGSASGSQKHFEGMFEEEDKKKAIDDSRRPILGEWFATRPDMPGEDYFLLIATSMLYDQKPLILTTHKKLPLHADEGEEFVEKLLETEGPLVIVRWNNHNDFCNEFENLAAFVEYCRSGLLENAIQATDDEVLGPITPEEIEEVLGEGK